MTTAKTVSKNLLLLLMGSAGSQVMRVIYVAILARYIGAAGVGAITVATALVSVLILTVNSGLYTLAVRDIASDHECAAKYVTNITLLRVLLTLVFIAILALVSGMSPYSDETKIIIGIYALVYIFDSFSEVARAVFHAYQKMGYRTAVELARDFLNVAISLLGIYLGWSLIAIVAVSAVASFFKLIISFVIMYGRFVRPTLEIDLKLCLRLLITAMPFLALVCISVASEKLGTVIFSWLDTPEAVGVYAAAVMPIAVLLIVPNMFMESIFPVFSQYSRSLNAGLARSYQTAYKTMMLIGFPMGAGTILVSQFVVPLVFGPGFEDAALVMNILAIQLFTMVGYVNGAFLNATNRQVLFAVFRAGFVVLNVVLCLALIPQYSYLGAAGAVSIVAVIELALYTVLCHRYLGVPLPWVTTLKIGVATLIMSVCVRLGLSTNVSASVAVLSAPFIYVTSLGALRVITTEEWQFINQFVLVKRVRSTLTALASLVTSGTP